MSHQRKKEEKHRLKKLYNETKGGYGPGCWYNEKKGRYIKLDFTNAWLKRQCKRAIRRKMRKEQNTNKKSLYKKYYDYWWNLY